MQRALGHHPVDRQPELLVDLCQGHLRLARIAATGALLTSVTVLVGLGVVMNYSTTAAQAIGAPFPPLALRHLLGVLLAGFTALAVSRVPIRFWRRLARPAGAAT